MIQNTKGSEYLKSGIKTKIYYSSNGESLYDTINDFIKDKAVIDIKFSITSDSRGYNTFAALIIYQGGDKE